MTSFTLLPKPIVGNMSSNRSNTRSRTSEKSLDRRLSQAMTNQKINEGIESADKQQTTQRRPSAASSMASSASSASIDTSTSWSSNASPKTRRISRSGAQLPVVLPFINDGVARMELIDKSALGGPVTGTRASEQDLGEYYVKRYRKTSRNASKWSEVWTSEHYYRPPGCTYFVPVNRSSSRRSSDT